jgi:predicted O-methyltransferase YrrM
MSGTVPVGELITSVLRVTRRDGFVGLARRARVYWADARQCRRFERSLVRNQPAGPGQIVERAFSNPAIRPFQIKSEILALAKRISLLQPRRLLEIGTAEGGTLFILGRCAAADATLISLDLPAGPYGGGYPIWRGAVYKRLALPRQTLHLLRGDSHQEVSLERVRSLLCGARLDFLFIDGDHSYSGVKRDFELYSPLVRPGGLIAFHDITRYPPDFGCEVDRFWAEIRNHFRYEELIENPDQVGKGIGLLWP